MASKIQAPAQEPTADELKSTRSAQIFGLRGDTPMIGLSLLRRTLAAGGILALASWIVGAAPLPNVTAPPGLKNSAPQFAVNLLRKGDRLPMTRRSAVSHDLPVPHSLQNEQKVPLGCDRAFSPVAAPAEKSIYGRCLV